MGDLIFTRLIRMLQLASVNCLLVVTSLLQKDVCVPDCNCFRLTSVPRLPLELGFLETNTRHADDVTQYDFPRCKCLPLDYVVALFP